MGSNNSRADESQKYKSSHNSMCHIRKDSIYLNPCVQEGVPEDAKRRQNQQLKRNRGEGNEDNVLGKAIGRTNHLIEEPLCQIN